MGMGGAEASGTLSESVTNAHPSALFDMTVGGSYPLADRKRYSI